MNYNVKKLIFLIAWGKLVSCLNRTIPLTLAQNSYNFFIPNDQTFEVRTILHAWYRPVQPILVLVSCNHLDHSLFSYIVKLLIDGTVFMPEPQPFSFRVFQWPCLQKCNYELLQLIIPAKS